MCRCREILLKIIKNPGKFVRNIKKLRIILNVSNFKRVLKLPKKQNFFLFGPRSTGKSTLIKESFDKQKTLYFDLLDRSLFLELSAEPQTLKAIVESRSDSISHVVIDEIQLIPDLLYVVHQLIEGKNSPYFCLSGSSSRKLKRNSADMLGGRAWNLKLYPFVHQELGAAFEIKKALQFGTLPKVYLSSNSKEANKNLKTYVETYIEEEIRTETLVRDLRGFIKFLEIAAGENTNPLNFSSIARESFNKASEVKEFFQILEDTLLGFFLLSYTKSTRKLSRHPKFYFFDTGVQRAISKKLALDLIPGSLEYGKSFEHWFIKEVHNLNEYHERDYIFSYYRTHHGAEVDLIVETPSGEVFALETKTLARISNKEFHGLKSFQEICPKAKLLCVTDKEKKMSYELNDVLVCSWKEALKILELV